MRKTLLKNTFFCFLLCVSGGASANYGNCDEFEGKTGRVTQVSVGDDESTSTYISFTMRINGRNTPQISVKPILDDNSGKGMYQLLLTAFVTQEDFRIVRCYSDQLAGGRIISKW